MGPTELTPRRGCRGQNRAGEPCGAAPLLDSERCFIHDPTKAVERAIARKKGGHNRRTASAAPPPSGTVRLRDVASIQAELEREYEQLLRQENSAQRARTVATLLTLALKVIEVGEVEERLAALEQRLAEAGTQATATPIRRTG